MLTYIFKTFIFPCKRLDYLGNPVIINDMEDEPWFSDKNSTNSIKSTDFIYKLNILKQFLCIICFN